MLAFSDRHHQSLTESLRLLFEKRLGHTLYFQKGLEWYPDYWDIYPHISTAQQYLEREIEGYKAVTLEEFKQMKFDILIASIPQHIEPFKKLISQYQPQAKLIYQVGNQWNIDPNSVKNILASANIEIPPGINGIIYHQEASPEYKYIKKDSLPDKNIYSFINVPEKFPDWPFFLKLEERMNEWNFRAFGGEARDGGITSPQSVAQKMREAMFCYHVKAGSDGFGHVIHDTFNLGTPPIVNKEYYRGKLAEPLMEDGITCITIDNKSIDQIIEEILHFSQPECYFSMSENAANKFKELVNYDKEEQAIRSFIDNLQ